MSPAGMEGLPERPRLGRRRRRLYWTVGLLGLLAVGGGALGVSRLRTGRTALYTPGEATDAITRRLDLGIPAEAPRPAWDDVTATAGLSEFRSFVGARTSQLPEDMGAGAAWGDLDGDGDDDLFLVAAGGPLGGPADARARSRLYINRGDGSFIEDPTFPDTRILGMGAAWGDYDGDGALDLVVTGYDSLRLFRNDAGRLVPDDAIASRPGFWAGASWADFDRDGDLDLYVCGYVRYVADADADADGQRSATPQYGRAVPYTLNPASFTPEHNLLFRNDGGTFAEVAESLAVHNPLGRSLGAIWHDFDDDGWPDLYVANDISDNALYLNREGRFEDASHAAWVADYRGAMGLAVGDWNRDGDDDLFVTHWIAQENALYDSLRHTLEGPQLRFVDVADRVGLGQIALRMVGWGAEFADLDADGWLDLAVANGSTLEDDREPPGLEPQPGFLFWNRRGEAFHDLAPLTPVLAEIRVSRGLAVSDYDLDGDLDMLIVDRDGGVRLLANRMPQGHSIQVRLTGAAQERGGRRPVDGARIVVEAGGVQHRRTLGGASYLSQSTRTLHVGLGEAERVDRLTVHWPDGSVDEHVALDADRLWEIEAGVAAPVGHAPRGARPAAPADVAAPNRERERVVAFWTAQRAGMQAMKVDEDPLAAIVHFREALALDPGHEDSLYYLANCLAETGDVAGALDTLADLMRQNPMSHRAFKRWGTLAVIRATTSPELDEAAAALDRAVEINREETGALLVRAEVALLQGDFAGARQRLEWVLRTNPQSQGALFLLAYLEWKAGSDAAARDLLVRAGRAREARKPPPTAASEEGDVRRTMHRDVTPLLHFVEDWNGQDESGAAFAALDLDLARRPG